MKEQYPERLEVILRILAQCVPHLDRVDANMLTDGRLLLHVHDAPFDQPIQAKFASDGTLKMLAYLTVLYDPNPPQLIGIEEPENHLHPRLIPELVEECRAASAHTQLLVTTHAPFFVNGLHSNEVRVLYRDEHGYTQIKRVSDISGINEFIQEGAQLGDLWTEGYFGIGAPMNRSRM